MVFEFNHKAAFAPDVRRKFFGDAAVQLPSSRKLLYQRFAQRRGMGSGKTMGLRGRRAEDDDAGRSALETVLMVEFRLLRQCLFFVVTMAVLEHGRWLIPELVFGECACRRWSSPEPSNCSSPASHACGAAGLLAWGRLGKRCSQRTVGSIVRLRRRGPQWI